MTVKQTVEITNKLGMHARPAMKLFELMQGFDAEVLLRNDEGTEAEANSVIALLMLDSAKGRQLAGENQAAVHHTKYHWIGLGHFSRDLRANAGNCRLDFALTKMLHPATPQFLEDIRNRSGSATVRVEKPGENYTQEFRDDRLRVIVDKNNVMQRYLCG